MFAVQSTLVESGDQPSIALNDSCDVSFFFAPVSRSKSQISSSLLSSDRYAIQRPFGENSWPRCRHEFAVTCCFSPTSGSVGTMKISPWKSMAA